MSVLETLAGTGAPREWTDLLRPMFPGAPPELIEQTLLMSMREMFRDSAAWMEYTPFMQLVPGQQRYVVPSPVPDTEVDRIFRGETRNGIMIFPVGRSEGFESRSYLTSSFTTGFVGIQPGVIELLAIPGEPNEQLRFLVSLVPLGFVLPDWVLRSYQDGIVALTAMRMFSMPLKPWTSFEAAGMHKREYEVWVRRYRVRARHGFNASEVRIEIPRITV